MGLMKCAPNRHIRKQHQERKAARQLLPPHGLFGECACHMAHGRMAARAFHSPMALRCAVVCSSAFGSARAVLKGPRSTLCSSGEIEMTDMIIHGGMRVQATHQSHTAVKHSDGGQTSNTERRAANVFGNDVAVCGVWLCAIGPIP